MDLSGLFGGLGVFGLIILGVLGFFLFQLFGG